MPITYEAAGRHLSKLHTYKLWWPSLRPRPQAGRCSKICFTVSHLRQLMHLEFTVTVNGRKLLSSVTTERR